MTDIIQQAAEQPGFDTIAYGKIHACIVALSEGKKEADSILTLSLKYPRFLLPEFNTHRAFSRSTASNRAIPEKVTRDRVAAEPFIPMRWGKNGPGMQDHGELSAEEQAKAQEVWLTAAAYAMTAHKMLEEIGVHKQVANRLLEPFQWTETVMTCSVAALNEFLSLRLHPAAQPEIQLLAAAIKQAAQLRASEPLTFKNYHIPYGLNAQDIADLRLAIEEPMTVEVDGSMRELPPIQASGHATVWEKANMSLSWVAVGALLRSSGRCARATFGAQAIDRPMDKDISTGVDCWEKWHASPFEHQAIRCTGGAGMSKWTRSNLPAEWLQFRKILETKELEHARLAYSAVILPKLEHIRKEREQNAAEA